MFEQYNSYKYKEKEAIRRKEKGCINIPLATPYVYSERASSPYKYIHLRSEKLHHL